MTKSLLAGAAALALIAGAAFAQEAYDSTVSRTTTTQVPVDTTATTTKVQKTFDPYTGTTVERRETTQRANPTTTTTTTTAVAPAIEPSRVTSYHEERTLVPAPQTVERSFTTETTVPTQQITTWSRSTTTTEKRD